MSSRRRISLIIGVFLLVFCALLLTKAWQDTMAAPEVRSTTIELPGLAPETPPLTIAFVSDIHVAGPDMPPSRLTDIVEQINVLEPDIVAIAGDFVSDKRTATHIYRPSEVIGPLRALRPRLGTVAVPGNHDHWYDMPGIASELEKSGIVLLRNEATRIGPLAFGGLDDDYTDRADLPATFSDMDREGGVPIILSHSPDPFFDTTEHTRLMLAGHTHCGQIGYPWGGAPAHMSRLPDEYACGRSDVDGRTLIVGAGLGTSLLPMRLFTRPEIWLIELRPPER